MAQINLILRDSAPKVFEYLLIKGESIKSEISKNIDKTYSHICKILEVYDNLVTKRKSGRCVYINLNKKGRTIATKIVELQKLLD